MPGAPGSPRPTSKSAGGGGDPGRQSEGWEAWSPRAGAQGAGGGSRAAFSLLTSSPPRLQQFAHRPRSVAAWGTHPRAHPDRWALLDEAASAGHSTTPGPGRQDSASRALRGWPSVPGRPPRPPAALPGRPGERVSGTPGLAGQRSPALAGGHPGPLPAPSSRLCSEVNSGQTQRPRRAALTCSSP